MTTIARNALLLLHCLLCAIWIPTALDAALDLRSVRGVILHSPVTGGFLIQEYLPPWQRDALPADQAALVEHGLIHRTDDGTVISRERFENDLPFLYAEAMRVRGLLPVRVGEKAYELEALRQAKLILGLRPSEVRPNRNDPGLYALLDSRPDRVTLLFPEDRFRLRERLEFVNADVNAPDPTITRAANAALESAGFVFPASAAFGRDTIIKPWDAGWFLLDATGGLFNLRRIRDEFVTARVALPEGVRAVHVQVQETRDGNVAGLVLGDKNDVFLLRSDLSVKRLACDGYEPTRHWLKVVIDPVSETCVYDDEAFITAICRPHGQDGPITRITRNVPSHAVGPGRAVSWLLAPLRLTLLPEDTGFVSPRLAAGGFWSLAGSLLWGLAAFVAAARRTNPATAITALVWGAFGGVAGTMAVIMWMPRTPRSQSATARQRLTPQENAG